MASAREPNFAPTERDFDLILMDQIAFDIGFRDRLLEHLGLGEAQPVAIRHSVNENFGGDAWGETDLLIALQSGPVLLIENKLSAPFQERQALRYRARAEHHSVNGARAKTILIAPEAYLLGVPKADWDYPIPYEIIASWIEGADARSSWRRTLLHSAGKRTARLRRLVNDAGARKVASPELSAFKSAWRQFIANSAEWQANPQSGSVDEFLYRPRHNPKGLTIWHHPMAGYLSVQIPPDHAELAKRNLPSPLPEGMRITQHPSTIYLDAASEAIDMSVPFEVERNKVETGMATARRAMDLVEAALG